MYIVAGLIERVSTMFKSSDEAESAFYLAFERADVDGMMAVWADHDNIVCIHPLQRPLNGISEIRTGWKQIFEGEPRMEFRLTLLHSVVQETTAIHIVEENILVGEEREPHAPVLVTNVYHRDEAGWRMVVHHASPAPRGPLRVTDDEEKRLH
jgi:ketosteroid isomerase-like protein